MEHKEYMFGFAVGIILMGIFATVRIVEADGIGDGNDRIVGICHASCNVYKTSEGSTWDNRTPKYYECVSKCLDEYRSGIV